MRYLIASLALLLCGATAANAQIDQDVVQVGGSGSVILSPDFNVQLSPIAGYFVTPNIEVGLNPTVTTDFEDFSAFLTAFGSYYPTGGTERRTYPFVGGSLGLSLTDDGGGLVIGGRVGVQRFISESAALSLSLDALTTDDFDFDTALFSVNAGFSIFIDRGAAADIVQ